MKSLDALIQRRNEALAGIRRLQLQIVAIDVTLSSDERYIDQLNDWEGNAAAAFPNPLDLLENPAAFLN